MIKPDQTMEQKNSLIEEFNASTVASFEELEQKLKDLSIKASKLKKSKKIDALTPIIDTNLSSRTLNIISEHFRKSYRDPWPTLLQISEISERHLYKWRGAGVKTVQEIKKVLSLAGLSLKKTF
jgi:DNA-directed RNA polymerase alpha subunit